MRHRPRRKSTIILVAERWESRSRAYLCQGLRICPWPLEALGSQWSMQPAERRLLMYSIALPKVFKIGLAKDLAREADLGTEVLWMHVVVNDVRLK